MHRGPGASTPERHIAHSFPVKSRGEGSLAAVPVLGGCRPWPEKKHVPGTDLTVRVGVSGQGELGFEQRQLVAGASWPSRTTAHRDPVSRGPPVLTASGHHLVRFYFLTHVSSEHLEDDLKEMYYAPAPDLVINS